MLSRVKVRILLYNILRVIQYNTYRYNVVSTHIYHKPKGSANTNTHVRTLCMRIRIFTIHALYVNIYNNILLRLTVFPCKRRDDSDPSMAVRVVNVKNKKLKKLQPPGHGDGDSDSGGSGGGHPRARLLASALVCTVLHAPS